MSDPHLTARQRRMARRPGRKLLGVDLGERRVGVAVSDDTGLIATPVTVIDLRKGSLADVAQLAHELQVDAIVAGLPLNMAGDEGRQALDVRLQCDELAGLTSLPIVFWDERLTTAIAEDMIAKRGARRRKQVRQLDAIAAAIMLQSYLDSHPLPRDTRADG